MPSMQEYEHDNSDQHDNESEYSDSPDPPQNGRRRSERKPRGGNACLTCRRMKTRCEYVDDSSPCKLCAKSNRECVKAPPRRKRRKTVTRIADLEQRIQSLTSALVDNGPLDSTLLASKPPDSLTPSDCTGTAKSGSEPNHDSRPASITPDVIDKGRVDKVTAYAAFQRYREQMDQYYGFVPIPRDLDIDRYRRRKPLLFSVLVLAGINAIRPDLVPAISDDILKSFAHRIVYRGERSLELVQCLLIYTCYHARTLAREHLTFYQDISTALTMALDLGLGRRMGKKATLRWIAEEDMMDARRAYLGCYYMSGQAAISLRHPIFVRWGPYIDECLDVLSKDPNPAADDIWLIDLIRLHRIAEDAHYTFSMDDPASTISLRDPKTQYHINALEQQLDRWRRESKSPMTALRARLCSAVVEIFVHEIALHGHLNIDSLRSPPDPEHLATFFNDMDLGPVRIDSLCTCLSAAHSYLDTLLELDTNTLRCLPNMYFVRSGYAAIVLKWLDEINIETMSPGSHDQSSTTSGSSSDPGTKLDRASLHSLSVNFDSYMDRTIDLYAEVGRDGKSNIANAFCQCLRMIKAIKLDVAPQPTSSTLPSNYIATLPTPASADRDTNPASAAIVAPIQHPAFAPIDRHVPEPAPANINGNVNGNPGISPEVDWTLPEFDANMVDVGVMNYFDPSFSTMGFWNLGGWDNEPVEGYSGTGGGAPAPR